VDELIFKNRNPTFPEKSSTRKNRV